MRWPHLIPQLSSDHKTLPASEDLRNSLLISAGLGLQGEMDAAAAAEDKHIRSRADKRARPGSQAALLQGSAKYCREKPHITKRPRSLQAYGDSSSADISSSNGR